MWSMKWRRFQHYYWIGSLMFWGTVAECATHLLSQWIRCLMKSKMMSFFFLQTGEAAHQNSMRLTASPKETFLKHSSIYRQSKTSCLLPSNPYRGTCSIHATSICGRSFIYNAECRPPHRIRRIGGCVAETYHHQIPASTSDSEEKCSLIEVRSAL